jgi:NAD(P)H-flavin reductase
VSTLRHVRSNQTLEFFALKFFQDQAKDFEVSGPFGKGLVSKEEGTHIAFAAGTGILSFLDLVAYIALKNLKKKSRHTI